MTRAKPRWREEVIHTRLPLWSAFALLFGDTQPYTYALVVQAMYRSGLSREELRRIFLTEVGPAFQLDLPILDSWTEDFVRRRVLRYLKRYRGPAWFQWFANSRRSAQLRKRWRELLRYYDLAGASSLLGDRVALLPVMQPAVQNPSGVESCQGAFVAEPEGWAEVEQRFHQMGGVVQFAWFVAIAVMTPLFAVALSALFAGGMRRSTRLHLRA